MSKYMWGKSWLPEGPRVLCVIDKWQMCSPSSISPPHLSDTPEGRRGRINCTAAIRMGGLLWGKDECNHLTGSGRIEDGLSLSLSLSGMQLRWLVPKSRQMTWEVEEFCDTKSVFSFVLCIISFDLFSFENCEHTTHTQGYLILWHRQNSFLPHTPWYDQNHYFLGTGKNTETLYLTSWHYGFIYDHILAFVINTILPKSSSNEGLAANVVFFSFLSVIRTTTSDWGSKRITLRFQRALFFLSFWPKYNEVLRTATILYIFVNL